MITFFLLQRSAFIMIYGRFFMWFRVLYEVFPMSFLVEQAGGQAFTGKQRVCHSTTVLNLLL